MSHSLKNCGNHHPWCRICRPEVCTTRIQSPEARKHISEAHQGIKLSLEHREALSRSHRGYRQSPAHRKAIGDGNRGRVVSLKTRNLISLKIKKHLLTDQNCTCAAHRVPKSPTKLEQALYRMLHGADFIFSREVKFGKYRVDAYVPSHNLVFEADGEPYHTWNETRNPGYHRRRDAYLNSQGLTVVHLTPKDLYPWHQIDPLKLPPCQ